MSDIPVGSPPAPPGRHAAPGGWYPDPAHSGQERYWDGWQWSRNTRPLEQAPGVHAYPGYAPTTVSEPQYGQPYAPGSSAPHPYGSAPYAALPATTPGGQANYTADGVRLASWGWRFLAIVIDGVILYVVSQVVIAPFTLLGGNEAARWGERVGEAMASGRPLDPEALMVGYPYREVLLTLALTFLVATLYHLLFLRFLGATPGKLTCRLRVVPVGQGRAPQKLSWHSAGVRTAVYVVVGWLVWVVRLLDGLWPLWNPKRQALHDLAARTQVIRREG